MKGLAKYWATVDGEKSVQDRIEGAMFSTLAMLDGSSIDLPGFDLVACPHEEDKQFHIDNGENWIEPETRISDALHEHWYGKDLPGVDPYEDLRLQFVKSQEDLASANSMIGALQRLIGMRKA
jgi:hypothetical protein